MCDCAACRREPGCSTLSAPDVVLPDSDGWGLLTILRADPMLSAVPIVMGARHPVHVSRAIRAGAPAQLEKPLDPAHVPDAVVRYCRSGP